MQARVADADALEADDDLGAAQVGARAEELMQRELGAGGRLADVDRQHEREAQTLPPAVEAPHQVDRLAFGVGVAGMQLVERVGEHDAVATLLELGLDGGDVGGV
jgi:hypothetical protein